MGKSSSDSDDKRSSSHPMGWVIVLLCISVIVNIVFTTVVFVSQRTITSDLVAVQERLSATDEVDNRDVELLSQSRGERAKRSASSPTLTSRLAVNVGSLFVSAIKQMCKPEGAVCIPGSKGEAGEPGKDGLSGRDVLPGTIMHATGRDGLTGSRGPPGRPGDKGMGLPGKQGPRGATGLQGDRGEKGESGAKGNVGIQGRQGVSGIAGGKGEQGDKGERGYSGFKGHGGMAGEKGVRGEKGNQGMKGEIGNIVLPTRCNKANHRVLSDSWRKASHITTGAIHCDIERRGFQPGWYAFDSSIGGAMPETCPPTRRCGTLAPGWLKGSHPTAVGQTSKETICFHWNGNCCRWQVTVDVINCGIYYVYNLPNQPTSCALGYCSDA